MPNTLQNSLETTDAFETKREALLALTEVDNTNLSRYALKLMKTLKENTISDNWKEILIFEFENHIQINKL